jgi:hypothetical protein
VYSDLTVFRAVDEAGLDHRLKELLGCGITEVGVAGELVEVEFCEVAGGSVFERPVPQEVEVSDGMWQGPSHALHQAPRLGMSG